MNLKSTLTILGIAFFGVGLAAQDDAPKIETSGIQRRAVIIANSPQGTDQEPVEFHSIQLSADLSSGDGNIFAFSSGGPGGMSFMPGGSGGSGMMNLLQNKSIRDEIELVDDQYEKMKGFYQQRQKDIMKEINALVSPALSGNEKKSNRSVQLQGKKLQELIKKQREDSEGKLRELLLPHQLKRLEQVAHQVRLKSTGTLNALTRGKLKEELDLSTEDVKKLKEKSAKIEEKLEADIAKLRAKAKSDLLKELSPTQRKKLDELTGEKFDYKPTDWRSQIKRLQKGPAPRIEKK